MTAPSPETTQTMTPDTAPGVADVMESLADDFALLEAWEDRYRHVIALGRELAPLPDSQRTAANKVRGCVSQAWLATIPDARGGGRLAFAGDSDAHIVRGLIAILLRLYSGRLAAEILKVDAPGFFRRLGLDEHLSPQRSNGLHAMVSRIRADAQAVI